MSVRRDELGLRSETVRRANLSSIAYELHASGAMSRSELGARTGLTRSTIRGLIGEFVAAGLVDEQRAASPGTPGRPSVLVRPHPGRVVVLALEIAVDSLAAALVGFGGDVLDSTRVDRPRAQLSVKKTVDNLVQLAAGIGALPPADGKLLAIGVAVVGMVGRTDGVVLLAPNLGWRDVPLGERLSAALDALAAVRVANEADLGALAEHRRGAGRGRRNVVFISGEVGVGGGLIIDGRPFTGAAGYGGEIGHIPVNPVGSACRCGSIGCWETEIGEDALLTRAGYPRGGGRDAVTAVLVEAEAGSRTALAALHEVGRWLGYGLAGLVNTLNPERVVLGGLFGRVHPFVAPIVERELDRRALAGPRRLVDVAPAELGEDAPLIGAAELAFEDFLADPAHWLGARNVAVELASA
ncbi:MAG: ROK family protein [Chloroflexota bacterium]|nr:ROK family protein [Chloroflexota bacterium]